MTQIIEIGSATKYAGSGAIIRNGHLLYDEEGLHTTPDIYLQNFVKYSEDISQSDWGKVYCTTEGTDGIIASTDDNTHLIFQTVPTTDDGNVYLSAKFKKGATDYCLILLRVDDGTGTLIWRGSYFNVASGTKGSAYPTGDVSNYKIEDAGGGYYKISVDINLNFNSAFPSVVRIYAVETDGDVTFAGDGSTVNLYVTDIHVREGKITDKANYPYVKTTDSIIDITVSGS